MIQKHLDQHELAQKAKAYDGVAAEMSRNTAQRVLQEAAEKARKPIPLATWNEYKEEVMQNVLEKAKLKALEDPICDSMLDKLAAKSNREYKTLNEMVNMISCQQAIPRLREVSLLNEGGIPLFQEICRLNPKLIWNIQTNFNIVEELDDLRALDRLNGSISTYVPDLQQLSLLEAICNKTHPDFRLEIEIALEEFPIRQLQDYAPILKQLTKLSIGCEALKRMACS